MSDSDLRDVLDDYVNQAINRYMASRQLGIKPATITSYDPSTYSIKATIQPDGHETGWFPHSTTHIGNNFGVVAGPSIGDQIMIGFLDGDPEQPVNLGRSHSDKERPPVAQSGEVVVQTKQTIIKMDKDGNLAISAPTGISMTVPNMTIAGNLAITGGSLTHNGKDVGSDHVHSGIQVGPANTGPPV